MLAFPQCRVEPERCNSHPRAQLASGAVPFQTAVLVWDGGLNLGASTHVSDSGLLLVLDRPPNVGAEVEVSFPVPDRRQPLRFLGEVVNVGADELDPRGERSGIEVRFLPNQVDMLEALRSFIKSTRREEAQTCTHLSIS
jgi:hypothetical protein